MSSLWDRFQQYYLRHDALGFSSGIRRIRFPKAVDHPAAHLAGGQAAFGFGPSAEILTLS